MKQKRIIWLLIFSLLATLISYKYVLKLFNAESSTPEKEEEIAFTSHIAPIVYQHCVQCHHEGGVGPFPLTTYKEFMRKRTTIRKVVSRGIMPPWPADPSYTHFVDENYLTDAEKEMIFKWMDQGFKAGDLANMPELPDFNNLSNLGKPDLTLYMDSILVEGINRDKFLSVKVPFEIPQDTYIRTIEFIPGEHNIVHHLNGHLLNYDYNRKRNVYEGKKVISVESHPETYLEELQAMELYHDDGLMSRDKSIESAINYLPGVRGTVYPEGIGGFPVNRKAAIYVKSLHYAPIQEDKWDRSHFNIFFSKTPPKRPTQELMLGTNGLSPIKPALVIPPDTVMTFTTRYRLLGDISVLTVNPHMHLLGDKFVAYAITRSNDTIPLIRINRWDFRWQYFYTFKKPVHVPKDAVIVAEATFDNTKNNPNNPYDPPRTISERFEFEGGSMRTTDEMFQFIVTYLPYQAGDENISLEADL